MRKQNIDSIPRHIGIIIDGNRRWAKRRGMAAWKGHEAGKARLREFLDWSRELGIKEVTVYSFSIQNFQRPKEELRHLFVMLVDGVKEFLKDPDVTKYRIRVRAIGRLHLFPKYVQLAIAKVVDTTKENDRYFVNLALGYGGREEITDAVRSIAKDVKEGLLVPEEIDESTIQNRLYLSSEPELVIRTSGEQRTSNFLPWQANYAEWYFSPKLFPDFTKADFLAAIADYQERERRYGR
jgi:tritrans,polycis-undecaprenyl-diphosphate synthase [geranylgeranyl-diphosphate specific]